MTTVFIVEGEHPYVPGRPRSVHATLAGANRAAADLVRVITERDATVENWRDVLAAWGEDNGHSEDDAWVDIDPADVKE